MKLCVIGLGYIGLPTAAMFAANGNEVVGVDINPALLEALHRGEIPFEEPSLRELYMRVTAEGRLRTGAGPEEADAFIICVPTPVTPERKADMGCVENAARSILPYLRKGNAVILESTSPPGTTQGVLTSILKESGLSPGRDLYVAYCPERVLPGRILTELAGNSRVIGGIDSRSAERARDIYRCFVKGEIYITDAATAEMCKLVENTYRDVNIALAAELAKICENLGINVWEVIRYANKHPRVNIHRPGPGVGGHCIAVDPWFIVQRQPGTAMMIELARRINDGMPEHVMCRIKSILKNIRIKKRICILGAAYKADVGDMRESPVVKLARLLDAESDYSYIVVDPHVDFMGSKGRNMYEASRGCHLLVLAVDHGDFRQPDFHRIRDGMAYPCVLDTRNCWSAGDVEAAGLEYHLLGWGKQQG